MEDVLVDKRRTLLAGLLGGLLHFVIVGGFYIFLHGPELFGYSPSTNTVEVFEIIHIYIIIGAFMLGAVPGVLFAERKLISPAVTIFVVVLGILLLSPGGLEQRPQQVGASNFAFYFTMWIVPLTIALIIGGLEYAVKRLNQLDSTHQPQTD